MALTSPLLSPQFSHLAVMPGLTHGLVGADGAHFFQTPNSVARWDFDIPITGVLIPWKLATATNQGILSFFFFKGNVPLHPGNRQSINFHLLNIP